MHQDQVTALPQDATLLARSDFCPNAALAYGSLERPYALSVQSHPEFSAGLVEDMILHRLDGIVPAPVIAGARARSGAPVDNLAWAQTVVAFFKRHHAAKGLAA